MKNAINKSIKPIFIIWLLSVLCYLPLIARGLTNGVDGLWASSYSQANNWELSNGRWAWPLLDKARGGYAAEPFNSMLTLLLIAISVYIVAGIFMELGDKPDHKFYFFSMLVMCSITVCCFLSYRHMSPTYGMSILLAVGAAWLLTRDTDDKKRKLFYLAAACCCLVVSLGLYQVSIGCFCVIIIIYMMKRLIQDEAIKCRSIFVEAFLCGVASCILYKVAWDICMWIRHVTPADYNGADSVSILHMITSLPTTLARAYFCFVTYFGFFGSNYLFLPIRIIVAHLIIVLFIIAGVKKLRKSRKSLALFFLLFLLLPLGANICVILAPEATEMQPQMTFPMLMVIPLLLCFMSGNVVKRDRLLCILAAILLYGNIYAVGTDIDAMSQGSNSSYTIMNNIVVSLNEKELISEDYRYVFIGNFSANKMFKKNELYDRATRYAQFGTMWYTPEIALMTYRGIADDIGVNMDFGDFELYSEILFSGMLKDMPAYPAEGSIVLKDDVVIVKVSEDYK